MAGIQHRMYSPRWWNRIGLVIALAVLLSGIGIRLWDPVPVEALRLKTFDLYNRLLPRPRLDNSPVAIVDIDEKSLADLGQWPWPRTQIAQLLSALRDQGAVVAGFDVVFPEWDRTSPGRIADTAMNMPPTLKDQLRQLPSNDTILAETIAGFRTVLGQAGSKTDAVTAPPQSARETSVKAYRTIDGTTDAAPADYLFKQPTLIGNIAVLEDNAMGRGIFSVEDEIDGIIRRVPIVTEIDGVMKPALSLEMLRVAFDGNSILLTLDKAGLVDVSVQTSQGPYRVPVDERGRVWVYFSEPDLFNHPQNKGHFYVSASDVLQGNLPPGRLSGKLVLIGTSAAGLLDIRATPIYARLPGVEVHANLLETILTQNFLRYPPEMLPIELATVFLSGLLMLLLIPRVGPLWTLSGLVLLGGSFIGVSWYLFAEQKFLVDITYPGIIAGALFAVLTFTNYARDAAEKRQVRSAFSQYLSPDLVEQLADHPEQLKLGGETRRMTLLFCDIRGFTTISEHYKSDPQGLTQLINRLLTPLTDAILRHRGTIDKYMGDCVMAFWNAPITDPEQERHACRAALDMLNELQSVNAQEDGLQAPLRIGIGINSGDCVVGNMGSAQRFDYSVLGDAVNLASRLEGQSKSYGVDIIVGEDTAATVRDEFALLELDMIAVKGKKDAVRIYALLDDFRSMDKVAFEAAVNQQNRFLETYRKQNWDQAETIISDGSNCLDGKLSDYYRLMGQRIQQFRQSPPAKDWDGVYTADSK